MTKKSNKIIPEHRDKLGSVIAEGDFVAYPSSNSLYIGKITKLNPKMVKVVSVNGSGGFRGREKNVYPDETVLVEGSRVTFYLLKTSA